MEIKGFIKSIGETRSGVSARTGNQWKIQSYVIETEEQYPRHMVFDVKGDNIDKFNLKENERVTVSFDIDAHEYNGRWYNGITAWKVEKEGNAPAPSPAPAPQTEIETPF